MAVGVVGEVKWLGRGTRRRRRVCSVEFALGVFAAANCLTSVAGKGSL